MPGWELKRGTLIAQRVSEDEYWSLFNFVFSDACKKTNTYKFGIIKSICDQIYDMPFSKEFKGYYISFERLFFRFTENYWNLVNKYCLKQMSYNGKSEHSRIEQIIRNAVAGFKIPETIAFSSLSDKSRNQIVGAVVAECKRYVIGALYSDFEGKLYSFDLKGNGLVLSIGAYDFISKYKMEIERINYYSWARFLEKNNDGDVLIKVLNKLDMATPKRKDLSLFRKILYKEFQEDRCFYCGRKLSRIIHVDHFIPWRFVKDDNLWNFVLACPSCNMRKRDNLVNRVFLTRIERRNEEIIRSSIYEKAFVAEEFSGYREGLLERMWEYAKLSGIREKTIICDIPEQ